MSLNIPRVEGLTALEGPRGASLTPHRFSLPTEFPSHKYASMWVEDGPGVQEAMQPEIIDHANAKADGWAVYKAMPQKKFSIHDDPDKTALSGDKDKKPQLVPFTRIVGKKTFVLMYRPKKLQQALNAIYADTSRELVGQEMKGESSHANETGDPGILTNADLRKFTGSFEDDAGSEYLAPSAGGKPTRIEEAAEIAIH